MTTAALFILLFVFMAIGMPVAVALGLSSVLTILLFAQDSLASMSLKLYETAAAMALQKGIIIADTKFEFGLDADGTLTLMDEVLTPDSSRFWPVEGYAPGGNPPSYDKQFVRDWLEQVRIDGRPWNKRAPAPALPSEVVEKTALKYREAFERLTA